VATNQSSQFSTVFYPNHWSESIHLVPKWTLDKQCHQFGLLAGFWVALCAGPTVLRTYRAGLDATPEHADPRPKITIAEGFEFFFSFVTHCHCLFCISAQAFLRIYLFLNSIEAFFVITRSGNCPSWEYVLGKTPVT
jgi:hypothetical protein